MAILRSQNKIIDFLMILAWASPFKSQSFQLEIELWCFFAFEAGIFNANLNLKWMKNNNSFSKGDYFIFVLSLYVLLFWRYTLYGGG